MPNRVLIVDDQKVFSRLLRSALETIEQGLVVSEAPSGEEALLDARRSKVDLLVADYRLPGMTGVELLNKFRAVSPNGKVIIISGVGDPRLLKQITDSRPDAFFTKPVSMSDFLEAVEKCLGLSATILHPSEEAEPLPDAALERPGLGDLLVNLKKNTNARAVLLFDDMGQIVAEAGQMPDPANNSALVSALLGLLNAARQAGSLIGHPQTHVHLFGGEDRDGIFLPVGAAHALLLLGEGLAEPALLATRFDLLSKARLDLLEALKGLGVSPEPVVETPKPVSAVEEAYTRAEDLPHDFLNIFNQIGQKADDANSFWDLAVEKGTTFAEPDKLTYEQASRLGLTPDSAQEK